MTVEYIVAETVLEVNPNPVVVEIPAGIPGRNGTGLPNGGTTGQILGKKSNADGDVDWIDAPTGGGSVSFDVSGNDLLVTKNGVTKRIRLLDL